MENSKICSKCNELKSLDNFYYRNDVNKYRNECKKCFNNNCKKNQKEYLKRPEVIEHKKQYFKEYYSRPEVIEHRKKLIKEYKSKPEVRKRIKKYNKKYNSLDYVKDYKLKYNQSEKRKKLYKIWYLENKDNLNNWSKNYIKNKRKTDKIFHLKSRLRNYLYLYIRNKWNNKIKKDKSTSDVIGCSWEELKIHLENNFKKGMSWENYGVYGWHIDHIIPLSSAETKEEIYKLFHYTNLQPLWAKENIIKSNKIL